MRLCFVIVAFLAVTFASFAQDAKLNFFQQDSTFNPKRFYISSGILAAGTTSSYIMLNRVWYADYPRSPLQVFNDNNEWLQMDKLGHATAAYTVGYYGDHILKWSGVKRQKALWIGGGLGLVYLSGIELLDGTSAQWGFSWGDMAANAAGTALYIGQELAWEEQRIRPKFSAHLTPYAQVRPNVLGSTIPERLLKDYNGQTYWLSANIAAFLGENTNFPTWLNVAFGYSGEEMIKGDANTYIISNGSSTVQYRAYRQYFLSLDIDLTKIKTKNHFLKTLLGTLSYIKIPFPALEFSNRGVSAHPLYF